MSVPRCLGCGSMKEFYKGKNQKPNALCVAFCHDPKVEGGWWNEKYKTYRRYIRTFRCSLGLVLTTSPRWCPRRKS